MTASTEQVAAAFQAQDLAGMRAAQEAGLSQLACLRTPITAPAAAQVHESLALVAFTEGQRERVLAELYAAHQLGGAELISDAVVAGHPLQQLSAEASAQPPGVGAPIASSGERITVDGVVDGLQAPGAAAVVQRYSRARVVDTLLLEPGEPLPAPIWPVRRTALLSVTSAAALGAGMLYAQSWRSNGIFWDTGPAALPDSALEDQLQKTNTQAGAAVALTGSAALLGIATVVAW